MLHWHVLPSERSPPQFPPPIFYHEPGRGYQLAHPVIDSSPKRSPHPHAAISREGTAHRVVGMDTATNGGEGL